jgi:hypothetical protein
MTRVVVHIDRLVLRGFRHEDKHAFAEGLQEEISRLFADKRNLIGAMRKDGKSLLRVPRAVIGPRTEIKQSGVIIASHITWRMNK